MSWQVVVGNIGTVYDGNSQDEAIKTYNEYVAQSKERKGRAAGESVVLFRDDGSILFEHTPID